MKRDTDQVRVSFQTGVLKPNLPFLQRSVPESSVPDLWSQQSDDSVSDKDRQDDRCDAPHFPCPGGGTGHLTRTWTSGPDGHAAS